MGRVQEQIRLALSVVIAMLVLNTADVFGEECKELPVVPAGTEVRPPSASPCVTAEPVMLVDLETAQRAVAESRLNAQLTADLVACERSKLDLLEPQRTPDWLTAIKYVGAGLALAGAFTLGLLAGGS